MKYCSHCGKELMSGAVFCTHCGQPVSPPSDPAEATINDAANNATDKAETAERPGLMFERAH